MSNWLHRIGVGLLVLGKLLLITSIIGSRIHNQQLKDLTIPSIATLLIGFFLMMYKKLFDEPQDE
jgi:predicted MFS family arabinose efflux permease